MSIPPVIYHVLCSYTGVFVVKGLSGVGKFVIYECLILLPLYERTIYATWKYIVATLLKKDLVFDSFTVNHSEEKFVCLCTWHNLTSLRLAVVADTAGGRYVFVARKLSTGIDFVAVWV